MRQPHPEANGDQREGEPCRSLKSIRTVTEPVGTEGGRQADRQQRQGDQRGEVVRRRDRQRGAPPQSSRQAVLPAQNRGGHSGGVRERAKNKDYDQGGEV